jgi:hypothetical protein
MSSGQVIGDANVPALLRWGRQPEGPNPPAQPPHPIGVNEEQAVLSERVRGEQEISVT